MIKKIGIVFLAVGLMAVFLFRTKLSAAWYSLGNTKNTEDIEFLIDSRVDIEDLASKLKLMGIIDSEKGIIVLGQYKKLNPQNIALGMYSIKPKTSLRDLLNGFTLNSNGNGNAEIEVDVVVPNVRFLSDLAGRLSGKTMIDSLKFLTLIESNKTLDKYGFTQEEFPAMFLPNTYKMYYDINEQDFLNRMAKEFKNYWTPERKEQLHKVGLKSPSEAVTLASIVYSEQSKQPSEWPVIARLYLNRMDKGIMLQSDPTFKYCWGKELDTVQRLLNKHREIKCDYNTYQIKGLPPGPICIPPTGVVSAVLNPDKNDFIFMCAQPSYSGFHNFAKLYSKHSANARRFQNWLAAELRKNN